MMATRIECRNDSRCNFCWNGRLFVNQKQTTQTITTLCCHFVEIRAQLWSSGSGDRRHVAVGPASIAIDCLIGSRGKNFEPVGARGVRFSPRASRGLSSGQVFFLDELPHGLPRGLSRGLLHSFLGYDWFFEFQVSSKDFHFHFLWDVVSLCF